ncbi:MAG: alkaline phosphatase family protein, partial [Morganella sp. (in: enterobacteria)]
LAIQHGCFYQADSYPDDHLFMDAEYLRREYHPDFLLIHPMNIDDAGHKFGADSPQYRNSARRADGLLSAYLPAWREAGYQVLVTSDHGMNNDRSHGGILDEERHVPLFVVGDAFSHDDSLPVKQTQLCGAICQLLGLSGHDKPSVPHLLREEHHG